MTGDNLVPFRRKPPEGDHRQWFDKYDRPHDKGRHGVMLHVPAQETMEVEAAMLHFLGAHCSWRQFNDGTMSYDYEYVYQGNGRVQFPWGWCGNTILFGDWKAQHERTQNALRTFTPGQRVWFPDKTGKQKEGIVASVGTRKVAVIVEGEGKYRVPPTLLKGTK